MTLSLIETSPEKQITSRLPSAKRQIFFTINTRMEFKKFPLKSMPSAIALPSRLFCSSCLLFNASFKCQSLSIHHTTLQPRRPLPPFQMQCKTFSTFLCWPQFQKLVYLRRHDSFAWQEMKYKYLVKIFKLACQIAVCS